MRNLLIPSLVFLLGAVIGHLTTDSHAHEKPKCSECPDYSSEVYVHGPYDMTNGNEYRFTPYLIQVGKKSTVCGDVPPESERYVVVLEGGEVLVHCRKESLTKNK